MSLRTYNLADDECERDHNLGIQIARHKFNLPYRRNIFVIMSAKIKKVDGNR